jgi:MoaA/NifB/PqqE/SkfB family radical SAM enzyme
MTDATFTAILSGLRDCSPPPTVFFGGFGEPLSHPGIVDMVIATHALGCRVELITNATLLTEKFSRQLIAAGLDRLWISLDGARPESYADVRLGAALALVLQNIQTFSSVRSPKRPRHPEIGIAFVAMRRNIADLPAVLDLGRALGAMQFLVTNVLPYTPDMRDEILYERALNNVAYLSPSPWTPHVDLPKMDINPITVPALLETITSHRNISFAGSNLGASNNLCPFINAGALVVGADGRVSPCLSLLHDHSSYLNGRERRSRAYMVGNLAERSLSDLWRDPDHLDFRERVRAFDFAPCASCGGCDCSLSNEEDCYSNPFPTCGGCLWAQGVIRCP